MPRSNKSKGVLNITSPFVSSKNIIKIIITVIVLAALVLLPFWGGSYLVLIALTSCMYLAMAQMWNLMAGYAGLVSLGQQIFIGLGGYAVAVGCTTYGLPVGLCLLIGGIASAVIAGVLAFILFRMKGMYFAIATWITAEAFVVIFLNWKFVKGGIGMFVKTQVHYTTNDIYYMALVLAVAVFLLVNLLLRSKLGLGLMAMRDNFEAAGTVGVNLMLSKTYAFLISGFVTGVAGGLFFLQQISIQPSNAFGTAWTVAAVFIVVIGGIGTVAGPIVGSVIFVILRQLLADYVGISMVILGVIAILVILLAPKGIIGTIQTKIGREFLSPSRKVE